MELQLTQEELTQKLKLRGVRSLYLWEEGRAWPDPAMTRRLEKVLYVEAGFFALIDTGSSYEDAFVSTITPKGSGLEYNLPTLLPDPPIGDDAVSFTWLPLISSDITAPPGSDVVVIDPDYTRDIRHTPVLTHQLSDPRHSRIVVLESESMAPQFPHGSWLLVNFRTKQTDLVGMPVLVWRTGHRGASMGILNDTKQGQWVFHTTNSTYDDISVYKDEKCVFAAVEIVWFRFR